MRSCSGLGDGSSYQVMTSPLSGSCCCSSNLGPLYIMGRLHKDWIMTLKHLKLESKNENTSPFPLHALLQRTSFFSWRVKAEWQVRVTCTSWSAYMATSSSRKMCSRFFGATRVTNYNPFGIGRRLALSKIVKRDSLVFTVSSSYPTCANCYQVA